MSFLKNLFGPLDRKRFFNYYAKGLGYENEDESKESECINFLPRKYGYCNIKKVEEYRKYFSEYYITGEFSENMMTLSHLYTKFKDNVGLLLRSNPYSKRLLMRFDENPVDYLLNPQLHIYRPLNDVGHINKNMYYYDLDDIIACYMKDRLSVLDHMDTILNIFEKFKEKIGNNRVSYLNRFVASQFYDYYNNVKNDMEEFDKECQIRYVYDKTSMRIDIKYDSSYEEKRRNFIVKMSQRRWTDFLTNDKEMIKYLEDDMKLLTIFDRFFLNYIISVYITDGKDELSYSSSDCEIQSMFCFKFGMIIKNEFGVMDILMLPSEIKTCGVNDYCTNDIK